MNDGERRPREDWPLLRHVDDEDRLAWGGVGQRTGGGGGPACGRAAAWVPSMLAITGRHVGSFHTSTKRHRYVISATRSCLPTEAGRSITSHVTSHLRYFCPSLITVLITEINMNIEERFLP